MKYRTLGKTGIKVSPYCLGTMMFGAMGNPEHDEAVRIIHKALDAGINFIDTADFYSWGESEQIIAKALKGRRDNVVLATKAHDALDQPRALSRIGSAQRHFAQRHVLASRIGVLIAVDRGRRRVYKCRQIRFRGRFE